ncbi:MAG: DNA primase [Atribacterota bacterium]|nr:DNA primase [Atribacterota bacterium]
MFIDERYLEEIKSRIDLVEFISRYVDLKPAGRNFKGLCPFHEEKTPSFMVSREKGIFHCFGCGVGGNLFNFVMRMENLTFPEAVLFLAEKCGVEIRSVQAGRGTTRSLEERERLYRLNDILSHYYMRCLKSGKGEEENARTYLLTQRGIQPETWERFGIGFSPTSGKDSMAFLLKEGFSGQEIIRAGVGVVTRGGELLDRFRGRITFAFHDVQGRVVGFAGRILEKGEPKYLNVSDTPIFSKGQYLYGLFATRDHLQKTRAAILVEGYMDFLALFEYGIRNCIASMGTSLTKDQAGLLKRYVDEVFIAYDADQAGQVATLRGMAILQEKGLAVRIVILPAPHDPDSFLRQEGKEKFWEILQKSPSLFEYQLELLLRNFGYNSLESKAKIIRGMFPFLVSIKDPIERTLKIASLAHKIHVDESFVQHLLNKEEVTERQEFLPAREIKEHGILKAEKMLLRVMMEDERWRHKIGEELGREHFSGVEHQRIFQALLSLGGEEGLSVSKLVDIFPGEEALHSLVTEIATREDLQGICQDEGAVESLIRRVKLAALERKILTLRREITRTGDPAKLRELNKLYRERERLRRIG